MATGALGSVSNRLRHENGDTHVVVCDDVFSDAGSTPAASTIRLSSRLPSAKRELRSWQAIRLQSNALSERSESKGLTMSVVGGGGPFDNQFASLDLRDTTMASSSRALCLHSSMCR